ncbi:hypothetical protein GJ744_002435 [Endocarpon pusillum]|uniref:Uncharacterized protein n=1 Tax=Endocarpon pusillum TaxID=364733 RepID=A0A8H7A898_9EURO|nr:hypothetical protein GJ744_002435 [Endocarpon pusillum]
MQITGCEKAGIPATSPAGKPSFCLSVGIHASDMGEVGTLLGAWHAPSSDCAGSQTQDNTAPTPLQHL